MGSLCWSLAKAVVSCQPRNFHREPLQIPCKECGAERGLSCLPLSSCARCAQAGATGAGEPWSPGPLSARLPVLVRTSALRVQAAAQPQSDGRQPPGAFSCVTRPPEPVYSTVNKLCDKPASPRHYSPVECDKSFLLSAPYPHYHLGLLPDSEMTRYCMRFLTSSSPVACASTRTNG